MGSASARRASERIGGCYVRVAMISMCAARGPEMGNRYLGAVRSRRHLSDGRPEAMRVHSESEAWSTWCLDPVRWHDSCMCARVRKRSAFVCAVIYYIGAQRGLMSSNPEALERDTGQQQPGVQTRSRTAIALSTPRASDDGSDSTTLVVEALVSSIPCLATQRMTWQSRKK